MSNPEPMLKGDTVTAKLWHAAELPLSIVILALCWERTSEWFRVFVTIVAVGNIAWVLGAVCVDMYAARLIARRDPPSPPRPSDPT